jgi:hypothetical protein
MRKDTFRYASKVTYELEKCFVTMSIWYRWYQIFVKGSNTYRDYLVQNRKECMIGSRTDGMRVAPQCTIAGSIHNAM